MDEQTPHTPSGYPDNEAREGETRDFEQALTTLRPSAGPIDRDRLMFVAGRAMAERDVSQCDVAGRGAMLAKWLWPSATALSTVAASVLGLLLAMSHRPLVVHERVYVHAPAPVSPTTMEQPARAVPPDATLVDAVVLPGAPGMMHSQGLAIAAPVSRVDVARIDYAPRTSLPPSNYVQTRQVALALGVEALGSWTPSGGVEHPTAYRDLLGDMTGGTEPR
jgi:hypothetical protein